MRSSRRMGGSTRISIEWDRSETLPQRASPPALGSRPRRIGALPSSTCVIARPSRLTHPPFADSRPRFTSPHWGTHVKRSITMVSRVASVAAALANSQQRGLKGRSSALAHPRRRSSLGGRLPNHLIDQRNGGRLFARSNAAADAATRKSGSVHPTSRESDRPRRQGRNSSPCHGFFELKEGSRGSERSLRLPPLADQPREGLFLGSQFLR